MYTLLSTNAISEVLAFLYGHWKREWKLVRRIAMSIVMATVADLFLLVFSALGLVADTESELWTVNE
jgi:hypothetical protein